MKYGILRGCLRQSSAVFLPVMKQQKHITIYVPSGNAILSSIVGPYKVFCAANEYLLRSGKAKVAPFLVQYAGLTEETKLYDGLFTVRPQVTLNQALRTDLIIIPALGGDLKEELLNNTAALPWLQEHYARGAEIASLCTGAFLLAATGLLDGRRCTTHWMAETAFRQMYPKVKLLTARIVTEEQGIYTSGGAYSFLNLILYLVEKYAGRDTAIYVSKLLEIDIDRSSQLSFVIFDRQKAHQDELVLEAQRFIEGHFSEKLTIDELAGRFHISRRNFERRFRKASGNSPVEYIQRIKIEAAKQSLESKRESINEVMYSVGYNDSKAFRALFKKYTGLSPVEYKQRYNREMAA